MSAQEPPVCSRCVDESSSVAKLEQHVRTPSKDSKSIHSPRGLLDGVSERLSLTNPLSPDANKIGPPGQTRRMPPARMNMLSSKRVTGMNSPGQPRHGAKMTAPTRRSPIVTPPQSPKLGEREQALEATSHLSIGDDAKDGSLPSPNSLIAREIDVIGREAVAQPVQPELEGRASNKPSLAKPENFRTSTQSSLNVSQTGSKSPVRRSFSISNTVNAFGRPSKSKSVAAPAEPCGSPESHTPMPSQDISPAKAPFLRELSTFFSSRTRKNNLALPSRMSDQNRSRFNGSGTSIPSQGGFERTCTRCGVDMSDWWMRKDSSSATERQDHRRDRRICNSCEPADTGPRMMPGAWD